jgi:hypothetical protein
LSALAYSSFLSDNVDTELTLRRFSDGMNIFGALATGLRSLSDFGFFSRKSPVFNHQNDLAKKQNDLYAILARRVFKVRQAPAGRLAWCETAPGSTGHTGRWLQYW